MHDFLHRALDYLEAGVLVAVFLTALGATARMLVRSSHLAVDAGRSLLARRTARRAAQHTDFDAALAHLAKETNQ